MKINPLGNYMYNISTFSYSSFPTSKQVFKQCDKIFAVLFGELGFKLVFSEIVISYQITVNIM